MTEVSGDDEKGGPAAKSGSKGLPQGLLSA